jgi:hypothetical protein
MPLNIHEDDEDEVDYDADAQFDDEQNRMSQCSCGAFSWSARKGQYVQRADCICGI